MNFWSSSIKASLIGILIDLAVSAAISSFLDADNFWVAVLFVYAAMLAGRFLFWILRLAKSWIIFLVITKERLISENAKLLTRNGMPKSEPFEELDEYLVRTANEDFPFAKFLLLKSKLSK